MTLHLSEQVENKARKVRNKSDVKGIRLMNFMISRLVVSDLTLIALGKLESGCFHPRITPLKNIPESEAKIPGKWS